MGAALEPMPEGPAPVVAPEPVPPPGACACAASGNRTKDSRTKRLRKLKAMQIYPEMYEKETRFRYLSAGGIIAFFPLGVY